MMSTSRIATSVEMRKLSEPTNSGESIRRDIRGICKWLVATSGLRLGGVELKRAPPVISQFMRADLRWKANSKKTAEQYSV
jgi:hypothetical protein